MRFRRCEIAFVRVKRPTEGDENGRGGSRMTGNRRKVRQGVFSESPEKGLPGHQSVFWCERRHSSGDSFDSLTLCQFFGFRLLPDCLRSEDSRRLRLPVRLSVGRPFPPGKGWIGAVRPSEAVSAGNDVKYRDFCRDVT